MQEELERLITSSGASMAQIVTASQAAGSVQLPTHVEIRRLITQLYTKTCEAKVRQLLKLLFMT